ncbi:PAS domain-containing protein [Telmatospirillum sp. J64-1]|uniref:PAS domain-containing protein n=1 Tax=Telmatospirillum sp. J64-1 TaxID=2502183 RepID=UPI00163DCDFE|nr:PAS domain-containing protein [Telmatospirillum sp. J64-1]
MLNKASPAQEPVVPDSPSRPDSLLSIDPAGLLAQLGTSFSGIERTGLTLLPAIIEHAPVATAVVHGPEHTILFANAAYRSLVGDGDRPLIGQSIVEAFPALSGGGAIAALDRVLATGETVRLDEYAICLHGDDRQSFWDVDLIPFMGQGGVTECILILGSNVTEKVESRQRMEQLNAEAEARARRAEEAERMLDALMAHIPEGITIADAPDGFIRRVSDYGILAAGQQRGQLEGIACEDYSSAWHIVHADGSPAEGIELPLARAVRNGEVVFNEEWLMLRPDGRRVPLLCNAGPVFDRDGRIIAGIVAWRDITQLKLAQEALRESEDRFRTLAEALPQIVWAAEPDGHIYYCNKRWFNFIGEDEDGEARYRSRADLLHPEDRERTIGLWREAVETGRSYEIEHRLLHASGDYRWLLTRALPMRDGQGRILRWLGTTTDIDFQKRYEVNLQQALEQKNHLLREINHRIKNSLQLISSLLSLQSMQHADPVLRQQFNQACRRIGTVAQVHERLYRTEHMRSIEFGEYLRRLCAGVAQSMSTPTQVIDVIVTGDAVELPTDTVVPLALIANELVTNACKYGALESDNLVRVDFRRDGDGYRLTVSDQGPGLPVDFDPQRGKGLGMRLVQALVGQIEGQLEHNAGGEGARMSVFFRVKALES